MRWPSRTRSRARPCSRTRTTSAPACSPTSSSASSGGRRSACASMHERFGVTIDHRSFKELAARAAAVPDARVEAAAASIDGRVPILGLRPSAKADALRLYVALGDELDESGHVIAAGINCLNESATLTTTPCLAWNLLFEERGLMWGCEADLVSMMTEFIVHKSLGVPGDDVQPLSVPHGRRGAQAREDPVLPGGRRAAEPHPRRPRRLLRPRAAVVRDATGRCGPRCSRSSTRTRTPSTRAIRRARRRSSSWPARSTRWSRAAPSSRATSSTRTPTA